MQISRHLPRTVSHIYPSLGATADTIETGNTILLCVAALGQIRVLLLLTGLSLATFLLGALVFGHLGHIMGQSFDGPLSGCR
jgi:hypothetical protein